MAVFIESLESNGMNTKNFAECCDAHLVRPVWCWLAANLLVATAMLAICVWLRSY